jgi:hypothetical protein
VLACCHASCRPAGKLKASIKATWLKDAKVDVDALTELSFTTHRSTEAGEQAEGLEQVGNSSSGHEMWPLEAAAS